MPRDSVLNTPARRLVPWRRHVMALFVLMLLWRGLIPEGFMPNFAALKALRWELVVCGPEWQAATARWQAQLAGSAGSGGAQHSHGLAGEGGPGQAAHGGHGGHRSQDGAVAFSSAHAHGHESHAAQAQGMVLAASAAAAEQGEAKAGASTDAIDAGVATHATDALTLASADAALSDASALTDRPHQAEAHGDTAHRAFSCAFALAALQLIDVPEVCTAPDLLRAGWVARVQAEPSVLPALPWVQGPPLGSRAPPSMRALA